MIHKPKNIEIADGVEYVVSGSTPSVPYRFSIKPVGTWSPREQKLRLIRLLWRRGEGPGPSREGYSARLSFGLQAPWRYGWVEVCGEDSTMPPTKKHWRVKILGVTVHYRRSYGGWAT